MVDKLMMVPNRVLLYELYSYVSDMRSVLAMVNSYIKWHGMGKPDKEPFRTGTGEQEPWVHRGGLHAEFRRILPLDGQADLFPPPERDVPSSKVYTVRPYFPADKDSVYSVCLKTHDDGLNGSDIFPDHPDLVADESIGGLLFLSPEYCFVLEDETGICGYLVSCLDVKEYRKIWNRTWLPKMREKYSKPQKSNSTLTPSERLISTFYTDTRQPMEFVHKDYPAMLFVSVISSRISDISMPKQLLACGIKNLQAQGISGVHTVVKSNHINLIAWHIKLGFEDITEGSGSDKVVLGQHI